MLSWIHAFVLFKPNFWHYHLNAAAEIQGSSDQATFFQFSINSFWWVSVNGSLSFLFLASRRGSSTSRFDVLSVQSGICLVSVAIICYLSYYFLSNILDQPAHSPLTLKRHLCPQKYHSPPFFVPWPLSVFENSRSAVSQILRPHQAPTTMLHSTLHKSPFSLLHNVSYCTSFNLHPSLIDDFFTSWPQPCVKTQPTAYIFWSSHVYNNVAYLALLHVLWDPNPKAAP